jgi:hypothetical protein
MDPVSCVSCVSSCYCVNAGETHETFRQESGMRYQIHPVSTRARFRGRECTLFAHYRRAVAPSSGTRQQQIQPVHGGLLIAWH